MKPVNAQDTLRAEISLFMHGFQRLRSRSRLISRRKTCSKENSSGSLQRFFPGRIEQSNYATGDANNFVNAKNH